MLDELGAGDKPVLYVMNKIDQLSDAELLATQERLHELLPNAVFVSAVTEDGLEPLRRALLAAIRKQRPEAEVRVPVSDGKTLAEVHRLGEVLEQRSEDGVIVLRARLDPAVVGRLRGRGLSVTTA